MFVYSTLKEYVNGGVFKYETRNSFVFDTENIPINKHASYLLLKLLAFRLIPKIFMNSYQHSYNDGDSKLIYSPLDYPLD